MEKDVVKLQEIRLDNIAKINPTNSKEDLKVKDCLLNASKLLKIGIKFFVLVYEDKIKRY